jgi:hypothetical protein
MFHGWTCNTLPEFSMREVLVPVMIAASITAAEVALVPCSAYMWCGCTRFRSRCHVGMAMAGITTKHDALASWPWFEGAHHVYIGMDSLHTTLRQSTAQHCSTAHCAAGARLLDGQINDTKTLVCRISIGDRRL